MTDMRALYQDVILEHNKKPRNFGLLEGATHDSHGYNPLCGDDYHVYAIVVDDDVVESVNFEGSGCAISKAAASMMTSRVQGKTIAEAEELVDAFRAMMSGEATAEQMSALGHLRVFEGVSQLPNRIKCAVLPWHTLHAAMQGKEKSSTEGEADMWVENPEAS